MSQVHYADSFLATWISGTGRLHFSCVPVKSYTPWKIDMEPENGGLGEDDFPFQTDDFQVPS